eukprot:161192-Amphidinium_carterae.1
MSEAGYVVGHAPGNGGLVSRSSSSALVSTGMTNGVYGTSSNTSKSVGTDEEDAVTLPRCICQTNLRCNEAAYQFLCLRLNGTPCHRDNIRMGTRMLQTNHVEAYSGAIERLLGVEAAVNDRRSNGGEDGAVRIGFAAS